MYVYLRVTDIEKQIGRGEREGERERERERGGGGGGEGVRGVHCLYLYMCLYLRGTVYTLYSQPQH